MEKQYYASCRRGKVCERRSLQRGRQQEQFQYRNPPANQREEESSSSREASQETNQKSVVKPRKAHNITENTQCHGQQ